MLFLVEGNVTRTTHTGQQGSARLVTRLVEADDETQAKSKFEEHYTAQSDSDTQITAEAVYIGGVL